MSVGVPRSVVLGGILSRLARLGIDLRPWVERQRGRINRPVADALQAEAAALRRQTAELADALGQQVAALTAEGQRQLLRVEALQQQCEAFRHEAEALRQQGEALREAAQAQRQRQAEATAGLVADLSTLAAGLAHEADGLASFKAAMAADVAGARAAQGAALAQQMATLAERILAHDALAAATARQMLAEAAAPHDGPPRISIIMPVRDRPALVGQAIASVLAQSLTAWDLIIVDDGGGAATADAIARYLDDTRIRLLRVPAMGHAAARNIGLAEARAPLIAYLDSDNVWFPGFLAGAVAAFDADPALRNAYGMLVFDTPNAVQETLLWRAFDAQTLADGNFIDLNTYVHRRDLIAQAGGFDPAMTRVADWDMILAHSAVAAPRRLALPAVAYRTTGQDRVTLVEPFGPNLFHMRRKRLPPAAVAPRILYALWHYPQLTESYIETEIRSMLRRGATIEVWSECGVASPYLPAVRFRRGDLAEAIAAFQPDVVHVHWLSSALNYAPIIAAAGLPMTVRAHGFETTPETVAAVLASAPLARLFLFPGMDAGPGDAPDADGPRILRVPAVFDTRLFSPDVSAKDPRLVLRTGAALTTKDLPSFFRLAARLPGHRFVLVAGTCLLRETMPAEILAQNAACGGFAEVRIDVPREEVAALMQQAGVYLHTSLPAGHAQTQPLGAPISIVEAMATGAYVLVRDHAPLTRLVGDAGAAYADLDAAEALIRQASQWDAAQWRMVQRRAIDRAWAQNADDVALAPIFDAWCALMPAGAG